MQELKFEQLEDVNGGIAGAVFRVITGGVAYDALKFVAREAMTPSGRTSSGGQMRRYKKSTPY